MMVDASTSTSIQRMCAAYSRARENFTWLNQQDDEQWLQRILADVCASALAFSLGAYCIETRTGVKTEECIRIAAYKFVRDMDCREIVINEHEPFFNARSGRAILNLRKRLDRIIDRSKLQK